MKLHVGRKWNELILDKKHTIENKDVGYRTEINYDEDTWKKITKDPNAIIGHNHEIQMGGTIRNTLEAMLKIGTHFSPLKPTNLKILLLGGNGATTDAYESHLHGFNDELPKGKIEVVILKDSNWATHQSYVFKGTIYNNNNIDDKESFRTLIRYQEKQKSFDKEIIKNWFLENKEQVSLNDVIYINSLKNLGFINQVADAVKDYSRKIIVAPTDNMYENGKDETEYLMKKADVILCNMDEAAYFVTGNKEAIKNLDEKIKKELVIEFAKKTGKGRIYISDDKHTPYATLNESGKDNAKITVYTQTPFKVDAINKVNAGDTWAARILKKELYYTPDLEQTLFEATAYASCFVSRKFTNDQITQEMITNFLEEHKYIQKFTERIN